MARLLADERIEAILHCAARSLVGESIAEPAKYYRDNVAGGVALLEAARTVGVERVVFSSTAAVYGIPDATPIPEDAPLRPINPYGETKRTFEGALAWYGRAYGLRSVSLRYFNVAGATDDARRGPRPRDPPHPERPCGGRGPPDADRVRRRLPHRRTAPASATTSTSRTSPTRTCGRSRRPRRATPGPTSRSSATSAIGGGFSIREVIAAAETRGRPLDPVRGRAAARRRSAGPRRAADAGRDGPRLAPGASDPRRDGRLRLGVAPAPPGRLSGLNGGASSAVRSGRSPAPGAPAARRAPRAGRRPAGRRRPGPVVADRPDQPQPDEHRDRAGSGPRPGRRRCRAVDEAGRGSAP